MRAQPTKPTAKKNGAPKPNAKKSTPSKPIIKKKKTNQNTGKTKAIAKKLVVQSHLKKKPPKLNPAKKDPDEPKNNDKPADSSKPTTTKSPHSTRSNSPVKKSKNEKKPKPKKVLTSPKKKTKPAAKKNKPVKVVKKRTPSPLKDASVEANVDKAGDNPNETKAESVSSKSNTKEKKTGKKVATKKAIVPNDAKASTVPVDQTSIISNVDETTTVAIIEDPAVDPVKKSQKSEVEPTSISPPKITIPNLQNINEEDTKTKVNLQHNIPTLKSPKTENERPPKFFTSHRQGKIIDIDQKTNVPKNLKITLAPTEKPTDNKNDELNKNTRSEKGNNEPEIDVYTFTDYKVDSPNSILTEYRNPLGRKIGRVRPIARVKGTIIDKNKLEAERKKVSPHRAPEDIVKQDGTKVSKSNKKPDELKTPMSQDYSNVTSESSTENEVATTSAGCDKPLIKKSEITLEDKTKKIVSKSYKMVSRKSTMFKKKFADVFGGTNSKFSPRRDVKSDDSSSSDKPCSSFVNRKKLKSELKVFKKVKPVGSCAISKKPKMFKKAPKKIVQSHKNKITKKQKFDEDFDHSTFSLNVDNSHETESPKSAVADKKVQKKDNIEIKPKEIHDHESKSEADDEKSAKDTSDESDSSVRSDEKSYTFNLPSTSKGTKKCISSDDSNPSKRRLKLFSLWTGPKRHRMASLNAIAKVHCLYENESRTHLELGLMKTVERNPPTKTKDVVKKKPAKVEKRELSTSESEYEKRFKGELESSEEESVPPTRNLRNAPGARGSGKYWDHKSSTSSSEDSEVDFIKQISEKKKPTPKAPTAAKVDGEKPAPKAKKIVGAPVKPRRKRDEAVMDLRDMVVKKRMASLNATAILAASYEKRSSKSSKGETTSDSSSDKDETYSNKTKNGSGSGSKEKAGTSDDGSKTPGAKQKVEMIVNQDTDVTITGVYSTHHEGYCTVSGLQYRISSTSHTQTTATTSGDQESTGQEEGGPYTPLGALSSMQPPAEQAPRETLHHPPPVQEPRGLGSLGRRAGGSSAFSAPPPSGHDSGYYQPAGPLIKESGTARPEPDERRALARYHPPHYHHQQMVPQYGGPAYYPAELCYGGRYYRPPAPPAYAPPPAQPEPQMVGVGGEPFAPPPQYYAPPPPCYQHPPQRPLPYLEYQSCPCPMQTCPKNVLIGPAIGNPPTSGGPVTSSESAGAAAGGAFPVKAKARGKGSLCRADDKRKGKTSSGKDPPRGACRPPDHYPPAVAINNPAPSVVPPEALGPPSPARASAGACLPHPPDRIAEPAPDRAAHPAADERVECKREQAAAVAAAGDAALLADLQTDIKKENSEPDAESPSRKCGSVLTEAQTLREHHADNVTPAAPAEPPLKPAKRRRSQPKLEIELDRALLEDARIDGMGDRIKLHKRQKIEQRKPTGTYKDLINASVKPVRLNNGKKQLNVPKVKQGAKSLEAKIETKLEAKAEAKAEAKTETEAEAKVESKTQTKIEAKAETKVEAKTEGKAETKTEAKAEAKEEAKVEAKAEAKVENRKTNKRKNSTPPDASPAKKKRTDENASATESDREPARPRNKSAILLDKLLMKNHVDHVIESVVKNFAIPAEPSPAALFGTPEAVAASPAPENESADVVCKAVKTKKVLNINNNIIDKVEGTAEGATGRRKRSAERARAEPEGERRARSGSLKDSAAAEDGITKDSQCAEREASGEGKYARRAGKARRSAAGKRKSKSRSAERPQADWCVAAAAHAPRWSNGWLWEGEPYTSKVFLNNDESGVRRCWAGMRHVLAGDRVRRGDCVLLRAAARRGSELPFVARVARLWENPNDGEMMVSLVWYYRPEHTERGRVSSDAPDEVFASRHRDANSVACIEDKCYVLTFNEYCRYRKRLKAAEEGIAPPPSIVPAMPSEAVPPGAATNDARLPPAVSPDLVLFCRKVYDFRSKKIQIPNK